MQKNDLTATLGWLLLLVSQAAIGCGSDGREGQEMIAGSQGASLMVYDDPYAPDMAGTPNPISSAAATASAEAYDLGGKLRFVLTVEGFPPSRTFGSHLHRLRCDDPSKAGGHYQHLPVPAGGMPTDPAYANATNEAWLDFTTDAMGNARTDLMLDWLPRSGEAKAVIIHHMATGVGGVSGAKLACLPLVGF